MSITTKIAALLAAGIATMASPVISTAQDNHADETALRMHGDEPRVDPTEMRRATFANAVPSTGDIRIDALMSGYRWNITSITYSFYEDDVHHGKYYGSEANVAEVSEPIKTNVREIMAWYSSLVNLNFTEVDERTGQIGSIRFMLSDGPSYAYAYYPTSASQTSVAGDVHLNSHYDHANDTNGFQNPAGKHGYMSLVHEIGHTLGLKHPHQGSPVLPNDVNHITNTVMSYNFLGNSSATPMPYDLLALHSLYGGRQNFTGNDTYSFTRTTDQYRLGGKTYVVTPYNTKQTIWDTAGINTIDFSAVPAVSTGYSLDMNEGGWLIPMSAFRTNYYSYGSSIAYGVTVRNLVNSPSADTIFANPEANVVSGYAPGKTTGNDVIYDADAQDTIDLSAYSPTEVAQTTSGNDLVLGLGANGSITLKDYHAGKQPRILFASSPTPELSVADVTVVEGNSGSTAATFEVTLSAPATNSVSVNYATANSSASAGSDYQAVSGTLTFSPGQTVKSVTVNVLGDTTYELDEVFHLNLSNATNATIGRSRALGTIVNDDVLPNVLPVASLSGTPTTGYAPLAVNFNGSNSYDSDGSIVSWNWNFGDGSTGTGTTVSHTYSNPGTYSAVLTVTDSRGGSASASIAINVSSKPVVTLHVGNIEMTTVAGKKDNSVQAVVTVLDSNGKPVSGAVVSGTWSGLVSGTVSGTTSSNGTVTFTSSKTKSTGTATFTITSVTRSGYVYDASANSETADSVVIEGASTDGGGNGNGNGNGKGGKNKPDKANRRVTEE